MEPPDTLVLPILPYQKEGLGWMYNQVGRAPPVRRHEVLMLALTLVWGGRCCLQEESDYHGGILADEMGMGKTIQAIALILANRYLTRWICLWFNLCASWHRLAFERANSVACATSDRMRVTRLSGRSWRTPTRGSRTRRCGGAPS